MMSAMWVLFGSQVRALALLFIEKTVHSLQTLVVWLSLRSQTNKTLGLFCHTCLNRFNNVMFIKTWPVMADVIATAHAVICFIQYVLQGRTNIACCQLIVLALCNSKVNGVNMTSWKVDVFHRVKEVRSSFFGSLSLDGFTMGATIQN